MTVAVTMAMPVTMTMTVVVAPDRNHPGAEDRMTAGIIVGDIALHPCRATARAMELNVGARRAVIVTCVRRRSGKYGGDRDGEDSEKFLHDLNIRIHRIGRSPGRIIRVPDEKFSTWFQSEP